MATKSTFGTFSAVTGQPTPSDLQAIADYLLFQSDCQHSWVSVNDDIERCVACGVGKMVTTFGDDFAETHALYLVPNLCEVRTIMDVQSDIWHLMIEHQIEKIHFYYELRLNDIPVQQWGEVGERIRSLLHEIRTLDPRIDNHYCTCWYSEGLSNIYLSGIHKQNIDNAVLHQFSSTHKH